MSPKVVNGSFAAIYDGDEFLAKAYSGTRISVNCLCFFYVARETNLKSIAESRFPGHEAKGTWHPDERQAILVRLPNGPGRAPFQRQ